VTREVHLKTFLFLPYRLHVQEVLDNDHVVISQRPLFGTIEFFRLSFEKAHKFVEQLEQAAKNASSDPIVSGAVGETMGDSVRALGTGQMRVRLKVVRSNSIRFSTRFNVGRKYYFDRSNIKVGEARKFAALIREAFSTKTPAS